MGIPSYFKHVVTKYKEILIKLCDANIKTNNFYLDCNSFIYDALRNENLIEKSKNKSFLEKELINIVCKNIEGHIMLVNPTNKVYIAFDGVAPVAKLSQQRTRRCRTQFDKAILRNYNTPTSNNTIDWNTAAITPGTDFMKKLGDRVTKYFSNKRFNPLKIIVSSSYEPGEGEHKIYKLIRDDKKHQSQTTVIYGLDADLIMLTLNHLRFADKIYLFRETPHFIRSIDKSIDPNENYFLDMPSMANYLTKYLNDGSDIENESQKQRMFDYIFICFFLGNDFMPHFPALNIRTDGIDRLMSAYKYIVSKHGNLTTSDKINWRNVRKFIKYLAENEEKYIKKEHAIREKQARFAGRPRENENEFEARYMSIPLIDRRKELYINPREEGWQNRYYNITFGEIVRPEAKRDICINYLEGLEWTFKYYTKGCIDWRWKYNYSYPPLLEDLIHYVPYFDQSILDEKPEDPLDSLVQLSYVLPGNSLSLLPQKLHIKLMKENPEWYCNISDFSWEYCRYMWEAHPHLPDIDIDELVKIVEEI